AARRAEERALAWLVKKVRVKRPKGWELYNVWAHGYGLEAMSRALREKAPGASEADVRAACAELQRAVDKYQTPDGGYGYYDFSVKAAKPSWGTAFTTATCMVGVYEAKRAGLEVSPELIKKAIAFMVRQRTANNDFVYSASHRYAPRGRINRPQGASMRNTACHLALLLHGVKVEDAVLRKSLEDLLVKHHRFAIAALRRPRPHESHYAVSGYFYLYGHYYAGMVLDHLSEADHARYAPRLAAAVLKARQPDGSFWDYPLYGFHKAYGTGYALVALARAQKYGAK
ncbi:MAG: hypothetical protein OER88_03815, partial [Planctomycetota bacterium]|nr:hypothetical protein [Planctomycetota bacterium]